MENKDTNFFKILDTISLREAGELEKNSNNKNSTRKSKNLTSKKSSTDIIDNNTLKKVDISNIIDNKVIKNNCYINDKIVDNRQIMKFNTNIFSPLSLCIFNIRLFEYFFQTLSQNWQVMFKNFSKFEDKGFIY